MKLSLGDLLVAFSHALDFMEIDFLGGVTNHSKRVAYIALALARREGLSEEEAFDVMALAILHDNGIGVAFQRKAAAPDGGLGGFDTGAAHCVAGQDNLRDYPFMTDVGQSLLYHHENWDGSGIFGRSGADIPRKSQIIRFADLLELSRPLTAMDWDAKLALEVWLDARAGTAVCPTLVEEFRAVSGVPSFWLDLKDEFIDGALRRATPRFERDMDLAEVRRVTSLFSRIIDSKSRFTRMHSTELSARADRMSLRYGFDPETREKFRIAADLHDIGKLMVSNAILDKPGRLDAAEIDVIKRHTYYTRVSLGAIAGFEDICEWASNHHERLDGKGYPYSFGAERLDFNARLLACLDIYQALTEDRPYRAPMSHAQAMEILNKRSAAGELDARIAADLDREFAGD